MALLCCALQNPTPVCPCIVVPGSVCAARSALVIMSTLHSANSTASRVSHRCISRSAPFLHPVAVHRRYRAAAAGSGAEPQGPEALQQQSVQLSRRQWLQAAAAAALLVSGTPYQAAAEADGVLHVGPEQKYTTIMAAVAAAAPGATIAIDAGVYEERLILDRSLKLTPFSPGTQVVVSVDSQDPYQYVLHILQTTPQPVAAAPAVAAAADAGAAADTAAGLIESDMAAVDADTIPSSSSSSSVVPSAEQATSSSTPAAPAPAALLSGTPVVVEVSGLLFKHSSKSVANNYALYVQGGSLILKDSDITSSSGVGVAVEGGNLQMLRCAVHDCQQHGVAIYGDLEGRPGRVLLEQCSISSNKADGVLVRQGARPILKECTIILNKGYGMQLQDCTAVLKDNLMQANGRGSIAIDEETVPLLPSKLLADNQLDTAPVLLKLR